MIQTAVRDRYPDFETVSRLLEADGGVTREAVDAYFAVEAPNKRKAVFLRHIFEDPDPNYQLDPIEQLKRIADWVRFAMPRAMDESIGRDEIPLVIRRLVTDERNVSDIGAAIIKRAHEFDVTDDGFIEPWIQARTLSPARAEQLIVSERRRLQPYCATGIPELDLRNALVYTWSLRSLVPSLQKPQDHLSRLVSGVLDVADLSLPEAFVSLELTALAYVGEIKPARNSWLADRVSLIVSGAANFDFLEQTAESTMSEDLGRRYAQRNGDRSFIYESSLVFAIDRLLAKPQFERLAAGVGAFSPSDYLARVSRSTDGAVVRDVLRRVPLDSSLTCRDRLQICVHLVSLGWPHNRLDASVLPPVALLGDGHHSNDRDNHADAPKARTQTSVPRKTLPSSLPIFETDNLAIVVVRPGETPTPVNGVTYVMPASIHAMYGDVPAHVFPIGNPGVTWGEDPYETVMDSISVSHESTGLLTSSGISLGA